MEPSQLPYDEWIREALRGVMGQALRYACDQGLPGNHHFYITFDTSHEDVEMPAELRARYPGEMTIVLQHQYWDLQVDDDGFGVTLKFFGASRHLRIPYASVTGFVDPAINFAIQLQAPTDAPEEDTEETAQVSEGAPAAAPDIAAEGGADPAPAENLSRGDVITLDSFRKNKT